MSYRGRATDEAYTGGIRVDIFFTKKKLIIHFNFTDNAPVK
jgi:hypothetical protein